MIGENPILCIFTCWRNLCFVAFIAFSLPLQALSIDDEFSERLVNNELHYYKDDSGLLKLNDIRRRPAQDWRRVESTSFSYSAARYWFYLDLESRGQYSNELVIEVAYPLLESVFVYEQDSGDVFKESVAGAHSPTEVSAVAGLNPSFQIQLPQAKTKRIYLAVQSFRSSLFMPVKIYSPQAFLSKSNREYLYLGLLLGILFLVASFASLLWLLMRITKYGYFLVFVLCFGLSLSISTGVSGRFLWHADSGSTLVALYGLHMLFISALWLFSIDHLALRKISLRLVQGIYGAVVCNMILLLSVLFGGERIFPFTVALVGANVVLQLFGLVVVSLSVVLRGNWTAIPYVFCCTLFFTGIVGRILVMREVIPVQNIFLWIHIYAPALGILIFSMSLANRIIFLLREKRDMTSERKREIVEETHKKIYSNLHDHVGARLLDLKLKVDSWRATDNRDIICLEGLSTDLESLAQGVRNGIDHVDDLLGLSRDFCMGLHTIALRRYSSVERKLVFEADGFSGKLNVPEGTLFEILSIMTEVINNDLKYGTGVSRWRLHAPSAQWGYIEVISTSKNNLALSGHGMTNIYARASEISAVVVASQNNEEYCFRLKIPLLDQVSVVSV